MNRFWGIRSERLSINGPPEPILLASPGPSLEIDAPVFCFPARRQQGVCSESQVARRST